MFKLGLRHKIFSLLDESSKMVTSLLLGSDHEVARRIDSFMSHDLDNASISDIEEHVNAWRKMRRVRHLSTPVSVSFNNLSELEGAIKHLLRSAVEQGIDPSQIFTHDSLDLYMVNERRLDGTIHAKLYVQPSLFSAA